MSSFSGKVLPHVSKEDFDNRVVSDRDLCGYVLAGHRVEVVAACKPWKAGSVWYGRWHIHVSDKDGKYELVLYSPRSRSTEKNATKEFKTVNGLMSYLWNKGFSATCIPHVEGLRCEIFMSDKVKETGGCRSI